MPVVDASVVTAAYRRLDAHTPAARSWLAGARRRNERFLAPSILLPEVVGAIARVTGDARVANLVQRQLELPRLFTLVPVTNEISRQAARLAIDHRLKGCDAIYVALAQQLDDVLVTFDAEQLERAPAAVRVLRPA